MGPLRELGDPAFLRWSNLRTVVAIGLLAAVLTGLFDAVVHGWGGVSVGKMTFTAVWIPLCFVALHLFLRRSRRS